MEEEREDEEMTFDWRKNMIKGELRIFREREERGRKRISRRGKNINDETENVNNTKRCERE
jgi:hypothetical protein